MADTPDLGSGIARCVGSSPALGILFVESINHETENPTFLAQEKRAREDPGNFYRYPGGFDCRFPRFRRCRKFIILCRDLIGQAFQGGARYVSFDEQEIAGKERRRSVGANTRVGGGRLAESLGGAVDGGADGGFLRVASAVRSESGGLTAFPDCFRRCLRMC